MEQLQTNQESQVLHINNEIEVNAPIETVFETMIEQMCELNTSPDGDPMPMKLETWPGGRWFRDLGDNAGHLWAHVQVIKPPTLLEITGPLFMSYPAMNHVQYRLSEFDSGTLITFHHAGFGLITDHHREGVTEGWKYFMQVIKKQAEG